MHILKALQKFQVQLEADGRSVHTRKQYNRHVRLFARWLATRRHGAAVDALDHEHVARFLASPQARLRPDGGVKKATSTNALRTSLKVFLRYCHESGIVAQNPGRLIRRALCSPPPPRALSDNEAKRLMATLAKGDSPEAKRDHAMFHLMLATGIRLGSAIALDVEDVDLDSGILHLRRMKGDRSDYVFLGKPIQAHLRRFLGTRTTGVLFQAMHRGRLSPRHVQRRYRQWVEKAGIGRATSTHCLRHSFATNLYAKTQDPFLVQKALRHRSIASTLVYARVTDEKLKEAMGA